MESGPLYSVAEDGASGQLLILKRDPNFFDLMIGKLGIARIALALLAIQGFDIWRRRMVGPH